jgi:hypothetical protein
MPLGHDVVAETGCNWYLRDTNICSTSGKKAYSPGLYMSLIPVAPTGTKKAERKHPLFSPDWLRTGIIGPPRGPVHVLRLEDHQPGLKVLLEFLIEISKKIEFIFRNFSIFEYFNCLTVTTLILVVL